MTPARNRLTALVAACTLAILQLVPQLAQAQELDNDPYLYAGVGVMAGSYQATDINVNTLEIRFLTAASTTGLYGRLGYQFHPNISVEGRMGFGFGTDEFAATATLSFRGETATGPADVEAQMGRFVGFYGRFGGQVGTTWVYGLVGLSQINTTRKFLGTDLNYSSDFGFSTAFGFDAPLSDSLTGTFESFVFSLDDQDSVLGINLSVTWRF